MFKEGQTPSEHRLLATLSAIGGLFLLSQASFSGRIRDKIIGRAGNKSEVSGLPAETTLHACHINHDKSLPGYDTPENGFAATSKEHYIYHYIHRGRAQDIGLSESDNESAIELLYSLIERGL